MLKGFLMAFLFFAGYGVMYLIYGSGGMEKRRTEGKRNAGVIAIITILLIFWGLGLLLWIGGASGGDTGICIFATFAIPAVFIIWGVLVRKRQAAPSNHSWIQESPTTVVSGQVVEDLRSVSVVHTPETHAVEDTQETAPQEADPSPGDTE